MCDWLSLPSTVVLSRLSMECVGRVLSCCASLFPLPVAILPREQLLRRYMLLTDPLRRVHSSHNHSCETVAQPSAFGPALIVDEFAGAVHDCFVQDLSLRSHVV